MYVFENDFTPNAYLQSDSNLARRFAAQLQAACDAFAGTPIPELLPEDFALFEKTGDRHKYEEKYFARRKRLVAFLLRVWLYGKADDINELTKILEAVTEEDTWALPAHLSGVAEKERRYAIDLFAAETAHTLAEALSLCGHLLPPALKERCVREVYARVIEPFESKRFSWEHEHSNWSAVCGGAVGMAAVYLIEDETRLAAITERAAKSCNTFIESCGDDGTCLEGLLYWAYAMQYYIGFDELYFRRTGKTIVQSNKKLARLSRLPYACCIGGGLSVKFGDYDAPSFSFGILCRLAKRYGVPVPKEEYYTDLFDACGRTCGAVRNLAWFNAALLSGDTDREDEFFPCGQWAILHEDNTVLAVKGGHNAEPHNHNDVGTFMLVCGTAVVADDLECPLYEKDYFSDKRYGYINASSLGHSLPVVNGCAQCAGENYKASEFTKEGKTVRVSFANAYEKAAGLRSLVRTLTLSGGAHIEDAYLFSGQENEVTERVVTECTPVQTDERTVTLLNENEPIAVISFCGKGKLECGKNSFLRHDGEGARVFYQIDYTVRLAGEGSLLFTVKPV